MRRFFSDDSFWNQPVGPNPEIDPDSDHYLGLLAGEHGGSFWINLLDYTVPVYEADESTPRRTVHQIPVDEEDFLRRKWGQRERWFSHGPSFGEDVPIPDHARPDPASDRHMAVVDWCSMTAWDMWYCRRRPDGEWESHTGMVYPLDGSGVWSTSDFDVQDGESIHFHGPSRAAGVPAIAGLIMQHEIEEGVIRHKLAYATWHNAYRRFAPPAAWTDGFNDDGLPEGAVMQIDPSLDPAEFDLSPGAATLFRALQEYGMVNVDNARANTLYGEGLYGHPGRSWDGLLSEDGLKKVPLECCRVLKLGKIIRKGDTRRQRH
ncbi:MAG: hypothetical protein PVJ27_04205 [Candidatus Brocadiaceae bacterium]|jgi:hypothetical protein